MNQSFVLVTGDFVTTGGMDRANHALASYLARTGHTVRLVAHRADPILAAYPGVTVLAVRKPWNSHFLGSFWLSNAGRRAAREPGVRVLVNGGNCRVPDANWVHYVHAAYQPQTHGSRLRRLKAAIERPLFLQRERAALRRARVVIANSHRTRQDLIERLGLSADRVHVVYYGVDAAEFRPTDAEERVALREHLGWPADRPVLLFIGALGDRRKGFDTLFTAWRSLAKRPGWDAMLVVVGVGAERQAWEERVAAEGLGESLRFFGFRSDVPNLLRAADALVSPTRYEAYGLGVHEALCCGLPAIVAANAGVAERYPSELRELLLPDVEDAVDLARRLEGWRADRSRWEHLVRPVSERLRAWTWDDMARTIREIIA